MPAPLRFSRHFLLLAAAVIVIVALNAANPFSEPFLPSFALYGVQRAVEGEARQKGLAERVRGVQSHDHDHGRCEQEKMPAKPQWRWHRAKIPANPLSVDAREFDTSCRRRARDGR